MGVLAYEEGGDGDGLETLMLPTMSFLTGVNAIEPSTSVQLLASGSKTQPRRWQLTEERREGLRCFEKVAGGDGIVVVGLDRDIVESFMKRFKPGPT